MNGYDSEFDGDNGDLDAAIMTAARSTHEEVIHVGLTAVVATKQSIQPSGVSSSPLGIQAAIEKKRTFGRTYGGLIRSTILRRSSHLSSHTLGPLRLR